MNRAMTKLFAAHDRYLQLDSIRTQCASAAEREIIHIEIMKAYLEVHYRAKMIAGEQFAAGNDYADVN
jgi:hypothetical protein